ncbi:MAG: Gfo/Idh/MocA family oxidoreductase [Actinobacteria bacterium]|nr:Gfo/Idh/MocA family oxidoreductase [Actinomycetota bacterium]
MGREHIENIKAMGGAQVTAISDPNIQSQATALALAAGAKLFSDHRALLESGLVDAVVIATPNDTHAAVLKDALATDIAVFVEKPLATTIQDCKNILEWDSRRNALTWMGLEYRFMPPVNELIQRAKTGDVGKIHQVSIREHREPFYPKVENWNRFTQRTGGTLVEKCCHYFNLVDIILSEHPVHVFASGGQSVNHLNEKYDGKQADMLDNAYVILEYASGARGMLDLCMFGEGSYDKEILTIVGDEGKLESFLPSQNIRYSRRSDWGRKSTWGSGEGSGRGSEIKQVIDLSIKYLGHHYGASYIEHVKFRDAILNSTPAEVTLEDGVTSVAIGLAAHKSIDEGRVVALSEILT